MLEAISKQKAHYMKPHRNKNIAYFYAFLQDIRPGKSSDAASAELKIRDKINQLSSDSDALLVFQQHCKDLLLSSNIRNLFSDNMGVYSSDSLFQQLFKDIKHKILPPLEDKDSINYKITRLFYKKDDYRWVTAVPNDVWLELFSLSGIDNAFMQENFRNVLLSMFTILSYQIAALGLDEELSSRFMVNDEIISPFIEQNKEVAVFIENVENAALTENHQPDTLSHLLVMLNQCLDNIATIRKNTLIYGTSLKQSYLLNRIENKINRLKILIDIVDEKEFESHRMVEFFKEIIYNENHRNNIGYLLSANIGYLAYQIAEHKGNIGEHYITNDKKEYLQFFKAAFGGGVVIAFLVVIKIFAGKLPITDFWMAVCYSLIYGIGFIAIHLMGFSVATKQPAMTASALASALDNRKSKTNLHSEALLMAKVSRSQFISVLGNLIAVFPMALLIAFLFSLITGTTITDEKHALKYMDEMNPLYSLCWFYGGIAGMYLFLSGIFAGYFDNEVVYSKIPERIREHPFLKSVFSASRLDKIAIYLNHNLGAIMGNVMIGIFLGTAAFIGKTFGLPFDIRHVTFSMGLLAVTLQSTFFNIELATLGWLLLGIFSIGFFNIIISFGLAFYVAIKSRNIEIEQLFKLPKLLFIYLRKYPLDFFYPPKTERTEEEVFPETKSTTINP